MTRKESKIMRRPWLWGLLIVCVTVGGGLAAWPSLGGWLGSKFGPKPPVNQPQVALETLAVYGRVPEFALIERSGRQITQADLLGKVWIANFFYTECPDTCPLQSTHMAWLQDALAPESDVRLVSISVDPEHDTPEVLAEYATRYGADPKRWLFLTGTKDVIYRLAIEGFRIGIVEREEQVQRGAGNDRTWLAPESAWAHASANPDRQLIHSSRFVLVDQQAQIRGYYHGTDWEALDRLQKNVKRVLREAEKER
jgi:protein SCO1/2